MKQFVLILAVFGLSQCAVIQSSTGGPDTTQNSGEPSVLRSGECTLNVKVLRQSDEGVCTVRVYQVLEISEGFNQSLKPGDKIDVVVPLPLTEGETRDMTLTWMDSPEGGYYNLKTGAE